MNSTHCKKKDDRLIFNDRKFLYSEKLFKLAGMGPIIKLYNKECTKMLFKNKYNLITQSIAIKEHFVTKECNRARLYKIQCNKARLYKNTCNIFL